MIRFISRTLAVALFFQSFLNPLGFAEDCSEMMSNVAMTQYDEDYEAALTHPFPRGTINSHFVFNRFIGSGLLRNPIFTALSLQPDILKQIEGIFSETPNGTYGSWALTRNRTSMMFGQKIKYFPELPRNKVVIHLTNGNREIMVFRTAQPVVFRIVLATKKANGSIDLDALSLNEQEMFNFAFNFGMKKIPENMDIFGNSPQPLNALIEALTEGWGSKWQLIPHAKEIGDQIKLITENHEIKAKEALTQYFLRSDALKIMNQIYELIQKNQFDDFSSRIQWTFQKSLIVGSGKYTEVAGDSRDGYLVLSDSGYFSHQHDRFRFAISISEMKQGRWQAYFWDTYLSTAPILFGLDRLSNDQKISARLDELLYDFYLALTKTANAFPAIRELALKL